MLIKLNSAIQHGNKTIDSLEVVPPLMKTIRVLGLPVKINQRTGEVDFNYDVCCKYLETINSLPPNVINQLSYQDFMACATELLSFFGDGVSSKMKA